MALRTQLLTKDSHVVAPTTIIYSTNPWVGMAVNGVEYFSKGPDLPIVFAELAGCLLAQAVGLPVPDVAAVVDGDETFAGSASVNGAFRTIEPWLKHRKRIVNFEDLFGSIVVDVWLANTDRNIGNVISRPEGSHVHLVFIDFEKSVTLRPQPRISSNMVSPRSLWPSGILGSELLRVKPLVPPLYMLERIHQITNERCAEIIHEAAIAIGVPIEWEDDSISAVCSRSDQIYQLSEEVWEAV